MALMPSLCMRAASLKHVDPSLKGSEPGLYADDPPIIDLVFNYMVKYISTTWLISDAHDLESIPSLGINKVCTMYLE
jgi:hypothetical protein